MKKFVLLLSIFFLIFACKEEDDDSNEPMLDLSTNNVLFIIADDLGIESTPNYPIGETKPNMPHLIEFGEQWNHL